MKKVLLVLFTALTFISTSFSQEKLKSLEEEYYDYMALQGLTERPTMGYRTLSDSVWTIDEDENHPWTNNNLGNTKAFFEFDSQNANFFTKGIYNHH